MGTLNLKLNAQNLSAEITNLLTEESINQLAKETGFVSREGGKLNGHEFLDTLLFTNFNHKELSLNDISAQLFIKHNIEISKQSIDERFTEKTVTFFQAVIEKAINLSIDQDIEVDFTAYDKVQIKDSTSFQLPENMKYKFPGSGGSASSASIRIQFEYDLKNRKILDLSFHAFTTQDMTNAKDTIEDINPNELIIRDLGYIKIDYLRQIEDRGAFYLNRLQSGTKVYDLKDETFVEIDFGKLFKQMKINNIVRLDKLVYIGANEKFKTRIIIERLPDKEYQERQRKANAKAKKNGTKISKDNKAKMGMNIFVTNTDITANKVRPLYTLRWQIELMFKIWKSIGEIDKVKKMKVLRFVASLLTKLIWVVINWHIMRQIVIYFFNEHGIEISPYKLFKTLKGSMNKFREALKNGLTDLISFIDSIVEMSPRNHRSEKKSGMLTWSYDVLRMF